MPVTDLGYDLRLLWSFVIDGHSWMYRICTAFGGFRRWAAGALSLCAERGEP